MQFQRGRWPRGHTRLGRDVLLGRRWLSMKLVRGRKRGWLIELTRESYLLDMIAIDYSFKCVYEADEYEDEVSVSPQWVGCCWREEELVLEASLQARCTA